MAVSYKEKIQQCQSALDKNVSVHLPEAQAALNRAKANLEKAEKFQSNARMKSGIEIAKKRVKNANSRHENAENYLKQLKSTIAMRKKRLAELKAALQKATSN